MASNDTTTPPHATVSMEIPQYKASIGAGGFKIKHALLDVCLRVLLFATALVGIIVMITSKQTKQIQVLPAGFSVSMDAKFNHSPANVYLVAALSVACLYSIITGVLSFLATKLQCHFVMLDALLLGIVAAATGAAGGVAYIGLKGNSHTGWNKICHMFGSFCSHFAVSILLSLISSITLLLLVWLSIYVLYKKIVRR